MQNQGNKALKKVSLLSLHILVLFKIGVWHFLKQRYDEIISLIKNLDWVPFSLRPRFNLCWLALCPLSIPHGPFQSYFTAPLPRKEVTSFDLADKSKKHFRYLCQHFLYDIVIIYLWCFSYLLAFLNVVTINILGRTILYCGIFHSPGQNTTKCSSILEETLPHHPSHCDNQKKIPHVSKHTSSAP